MTQFTAIALDPGGTTGWASYTATKMEWWDNREGPERFEWYEEHWNCGQFGSDDTEETIDILLGTMHTTEYHIICERFTVRPGKVGAQLDVAPKIIGEVEAFIKQRNRDIEGLRTHQIKLHMQEVSAAKGFVKDRNIKKLSLWSPGFKHAMDAQRHLLYWMIHGEYKRTDLLRHGWKF